MSPPPHHLMAAAAAAAAGKGYQGGQPGQGGDLRQMISMYLPPHHQSHAQHQGMEQLHNPYPTPSPDQQHQQQQQMGHLA